MTRYSEMIINPNTGSWCNPSDLSLCPPYHVNAKTNQRVYRNDTKGKGWVGDPTTWTLDVGGLSQRLYFYQDPGTPPAPRSWTSIDVGTEIFISSEPETAEWIISDFDVLSSDEV